ncbi:MAG TPA: molybdenum cofactor guanylyltransferase [Thiotrichales bacterium]|nr:molybdenum cofactor guanylyltransferase [Thiotrichales bacterium]
MTLSPAEITGLILAGGRGRRMGGADKGLLPFRGRPLVEHLIDRLVPQVGELLINANRNRDRYGRYGLRLVSDPLTGYQGPLAGMLAGLEAAESRWLAVVPCDAPFLPEELVGRLAEAAAREGTSIAVAHDGERLQPVHALLTVELAGELRRFLAAGERKIDRWYGRQRLTLVDFSDAPEAFGNLNRPEDRQRLEVGS